MGCNNGCTHCRRTAAAASVTLSPAPAFVAENGEGY